MDCSVLYLDNNATSSVAPEVLEAMRPYFLTPGNAESRHSLGRRARQAWDLAREQVASILGCAPSEVIFTSGGTEANNLAIFGLAGAEHSPGRFLASSIEHPAVAEPIARLEAAGFEVRRPSVSSEGLVEVDQLDTLLDPDLRFATLMLANNETGAIQPVEGLAIRAQAHGIPVHTDAVQAVGRIPVDFAQLGVTTLAASAHKFHGPPGIGLLLVRSGVRLGSRLFGGGQQYGRRPGTVPIALVVGLAKALEDWHRDYEGRISHWRRLINLLEAELRQRLGSEAVIRNGPRDEARQLPQTLNLGFPGLDGDLLLMQLDLAGVAVSLGAACASGSTRPSPTLQAMRVPDAWLRSSVRFSLGAGTTECEIREAIERIVEVVVKVRANRSTQCDS